MRSARLIKKTLQSVCCCSALCLSAYASAAEHIAPPALSSIENSDIKRLLPNDEIKPILAGDTEFLSLYSEYMSREFRGIVLLIPDWNSTPTSNAGMSYLRRALTNLGYTTYAMTVPDIDWQASNMAVPAQAAAQSTKPAQNEAPTETAQNNSDDAATAAQEPHFVNAIDLVSDEVLSNYKTNLIMRYEALYQNAMSEPNNIVVIAQGTSAGVLLEYYANFPDSRIDAFISLSSYLPNTQRNKGLAQTSSLVTPALLDIYYANDNTDILMSLKNRQRWVNRNAKFDYRQRQLFGLRDAPEQHARLSKIIDGFLRRLF